MRLRVIGYNVRGFRDGFERLVRLVGHFEPDLAVLNETGSRWRLRRFANALGMELAADPWSPFRRRVKDAVLVRPPWTIPEHYLFVSEGIVVERVLVPQGPDAREASDHRPLVAELTLPGSE